MSSFFTYALREPTGKSRQKDTLDTKVYLFYNQEKRERRELHEFHGQSYCSETS